MSETESLKKRSSNHINEPISSKKLTSICAIKLDDTSANCIENNESHKIPEVSCPTESLSRNKRLFTSLMGHLGNAKKNLEKDSRINIQNAAINTATEKHYHESQRIYMFDKKINDSIQAKESKLKDKVTVEKKIKEAYKRAQDWNSRIDKNIQVHTKVLPSLSWEPCRHNEVFKIILESTKEEVAKLKADREVVDSEIINNLKNKLHEIDADIQNLDAFLLSDEVKLISSKSKPSIESKAIVEDGEIVTFPTKASSHRVDHRYNKNSAEYLRSDALSLHQTNTSR